MNDIHSQKETGVLYISTGQKYVSEVFDSVRTLKRETDIDCTLITDKPVEHNLIDDIILRENPDDRPDNAYKLYNISETPYEKTIYLDSDTYVRNDISELFSILDSFDLSMTQAPVRNTDRLPDLPQWFPEYNCGVMLFNDNDTTSEFFEQWRTNYELLDFQQDQPSFRKTLFESGIDYFTMLREYNVRFWPGYVDEDVRIVHTHLDNQAIASRLAETSGPRAYHYRDNEIQLRQNHHSLPRRVQSSLRRNGLLGTFKRAVRKLGDGED